ncbi:MAG: patatin-like phospholipase family protein [Phycisphaerales bacterium]|nr:patatin-like phospholipase family protein [Phycisphaerales bacterium]
MSAYAAAVIERDTEKFRTSSRNLLRRLDAKLEASATREPPTVHFLALSGGGDYGAFGAGFLVGWGQNPDPAWKRPEFDIVTGVSTGALLAPFAFIGTDDACRHVEEFYRNPRKDWIESRGLLFFLPSNPSFMGIPGLERDLHAAIDPALVEQIAGQSRLGKMLLISATDIELGRRSGWDVGIEAQAAATSGDSSRLRKILLASSAIPAVFPPVEIDGSLYVDGGVTANVLVRLDLKSPESMVRSWIREHPDDPLPRIRYWVVINNSLNQAPKTVQPRWPAIISPSLSVAIRSATIAEARWLAAQADYANATLNADIEVRVVAIPDDWRPPVAGDFQRETMVSLSDLGRRMGADANSWQLWAAPGGRGSGGLIPTLTTSP